MKLIFLYGLILVIVFGFVNASQSVNVVSAKPPAEATRQLAVENISGPSLAATAYGVFDIETGELLFSQNENAELPIASITKLFTAATTIEQTVGDEILTVTAEDVATEGRAGKLEAGQTYEVRELLFPLLLESSNDAAATFERLVKDISFGDKILADGSGLSSQNIASVEELSYEVRKLYLSAPHIFDMTTLKQYVGENTGWVNNSPVYDLPGYKGGKHGYTVEANRTLAAVFEEASLDGRELGYVILGSDDVRADVLALRSVVENSVHLE